MLLLVHYIIDGDVVLSYHIVGGVIGSLHC